ncbi:hypothetical protein [Thermomonas sp.]|uniref:DUF6630 family protein n=1 Tax=Thermomonas sp. TaxID=1971895 RepID=UPI002488AFC4|nr:hypothetical protein [Thermomonas sp.]MDI1254172.1 hypothetical protein [Thermomonas sp.]
MAAHEYDPDDNFDHAFHAQVGLDDEAALEVVAWQFLMLVNPDDEDAAQEQFANFRQALEDQGESADPVALLREAIDWKAGFCVHEDDAQALMEAVDELVSRWQLRIEWGLDDDESDEVQDPADLLHSAYTQLRARHYSLWTVETGEYQLAGWIIRERDEEAMQLVAGALGMHARVGVG